MKKLLTLFAVFALTAPVLAADGDPNVLITCEAVGNDVTVSYELLAEDDFDPATNPLRGLALNITVDGGATIDAISNYAAEGFTTPVDSAGIDAVPGFIIYMGSIGFATDPNLVADFGDPVAPSDDPGALGGLGTPGITVEMGTLYSENGTGPGSSGVLFTITVSGPTTVTIEGESTRGGDLGEAVLENDGAIANVVSAGCEVTGVTDCYIIGQPRYYDENMNPGPAITQANYDAWVAAGKPLCWCCPHHGYGDVNGDGFINASDVPLVWNAVKLGQSPTYADVNHDGVVNASDVPPVWNTVKAAVGQLPNTCADCP
jgi:hypothetical protein